MTQYLIGHPDTAAVIGLGQTPTSQAVQSIRTPGLRSRPAGFDISKEILDDIKNGALIATVDQQPYSQGFYAVTQLALNLKYGLYPSEMDTGGSGLVDKSNYQYAAKWAGLRFANEASSDEFIFAEAIGPRGVPASSRVKRGPPSQESNPMHRRV